MKERWDLYTKERICTGKTIFRGDAVPDGLFHIVVQVWIVNKDGRFLISRRDPHKKWPLRWEPTAGSVLAGESSLDGALREVREEVGITLRKEDGTLFSTLRRDDWECPGFLDVYVFHFNGDGKDIRLQEGETVAAEWLDREQIQEMMQKGQFICMQNLPYHEEILKQYGR